MRRYLSGQRGLVLLQIDTEALKTAGVRAVAEWVASRNDHFTHVFGAIPLAAITAHWHQEGDADLSLPAELRSQLVKAE